MKVLYFDCFSGISGDMTLGTLIDLGADRNKLIEDLKGLHAEGYEIKIEKKLKRGIMGTDVTVLLEHEQHEDHHHHSDHGHDHPHQEEHQHHHHEDRTYKEILELIDNSHLSEKVKAMSRKIFAVVAEAEAKIHGVPLMEVHFHEVGALDSIVDIIGTAICIDQLGIEKIVFSKLPLSHGFVKCQHGTFPLPAPATLEILKGVPVYYNESGFEQVTPTGAAIAKALADSFGSAGEGLVEKTGYGLGKKETETPNVLRTMIINEFVKTIPANEVKDRIAQLEANLDDMTPEQMGYAMDILFEAGALDVFFTAVQMKKNRPGTLLTVLCKVEDKKKLIGLILKETSTFGVRHMEMERDILDRESIEVEIQGGKIRCKIGRLEGQVIRIAPEYEDCKNTAARLGKPLQDIYQEALAKARSCMNIS